MNKLAIPAILVSITLVAGIFAFLPVEKASTVHTTIQGSQLTEVSTVLDTELKTNTTATCGAGEEGLVYYHLSNRTVAPTTTTTIVVDPDGAGGVAGLVIEFSENSTSASGVIGLDVGETANFGLDDTGSQDTADVLVTVICQSDGEAAASAN